MICEKMNLIQRILYGVRWYKLSRQCSECEGCGESKNDPNFDCIFCSGSGIERREVAHTGAWTEPHREAGWKVEKMSVFYSHSLPTKERGSE